MGDPTQRATAPAAAARRTLGVVRAVLVVNPKATSTSSRAQDVIVHALSHDLDLDVHETARRGHAFDLARTARSDGVDVVVCLGGDGTVNEVVNGLLADGLDGPRPVLGTVPGGSANVLSRALGLPVDQIEATGMLLDALADKRTRRIGLGHARWVTSDGTCGDDPDPHGWAAQHGPARYFTLNAGLGIDATVVAAMERQRREGAVATPARYVRTTLAEFFRSERRDPAITVHRSGVDAVDRVHYAFVQNAAPWTYLGAIRVDPCPLASFETGLDLFAARTMSVPASLGNTRRILTGHGSATSRRLLALHDQAELDLTADRAVPLQVDGDYCGTVTSLTVRSVPEALDVLC